MLTPEWEAALDDLDERMTVLLDQITDMNRRMAENLAWIEDQLDQVAHREPAEYVNREELRGY